MKITPNRVETRQLINYIYNMKTDRQKPQTSPTRRQDEIYFSSLPLFSMDKKKLKEELDNIVLRKEGK